MRPPSAACFRRPRTRERSVLGCLAAPAAAGRCARCAGSAATGPARAAAAAVLPALSAPAAARAQEASSQGLPGLAERVLPEVLVGPEVLSLALWQWIALLIAVAVAGLLAWALAYGVLGAARRLVARTETDVDDRFLDASAGPLRLVIAVLVYRSAMAPLGLGEEASELLELLLRMVFILAVGWLLLRLADVLGALAEERLLARGQAAAVGLVPPGRKVVKAFVLVVAALALLDAFGFNVTALVAGLGVGGIAVALAAQKTVENLFGGVTLYTDRPVRVGDFCRFGDKVGTVEDIGLRSTRLRTLDRTLVSVPNADFAALHLENFAVRDRILISTRLGLRYETTPEQLRYVLVGIRRLLYAHARVSPDPARVRFVGFGDYSLDLEIFAYVETRDWNEFLGIREDLFLRIMDLVEESGTGFAFPSSTVYLGRDEPPGEERARQVDEQVARWRERRELYLPEFPAEKVRELRGEVGYPPPGSPDAPESSAGGGGR